LPRGDRPLLPGAGDRAADRTAAPARCDQPLAGLRADDVPAGPGRPGPGRLVLPHRPRRHPQARWRPRGLRPTVDRPRPPCLRPALLIGLALLAGVVEAASMIPYLAAMGIIAEMGIGLGQGSLVLVAYCAVMIVPAALLCAVRAALGTRADRALDRAHEWAVKHTTSVFFWAVGIIGAILLLNTAGPALAWLGVS